VFARVPQFVSGEAVLFDSRTSAARLPQGDRLSQLRVRLATGGRGGDSGPVDGGLLLLLYVDDLAAPRARICLADLLRQGGRRPLNVRYRPGQVVRLVLLDPHDAWASGAPPLPVILA
jgi:Ca-activated chloride channel family protein